MSNASRRRFFQISLNRLVLLVLAVGALGCLNFRPTFSDRGFGWADFGWPCAAISFRWMSLSETPAPAVTGPEIDDAEKEADFRAEMRDCPARYSIYPLSKGTVAVVYNESRWVQTSGLILDVVASLVILVFLALLSSATFPGRHANILDFSV